MINFDTLLLDISDGLATITLNRPDKLNALNNKLKQELVAAIRYVATAKNGARCLLMTGAGKAFCAGADLSENASPDAGWDAGASLIDTYHPILLELASLKMPIVSAVNGAAAGAGMSLAITADIVIAADTAYFLQAFINIGLIPDAGSTYILPRLIGESRARAMMMLGEKVSAQKAHDWGMVYSVVPEDHLSKTARTLAEKLSKGPTSALSNIRQLMATSSTNSFSAQLQAEAMAQRAACQTSDCVEGVTAFLEKRHAIFSGR